MNDKETQVFAELLARRRQLIQMRVAESNRLALARGHRVCKSIEGVIKLLERQISAIDDEIDHHIQSSPIWKEKQELLLTVKGVGPTTARTLLAELPELGQASR